MTFEHKKWPHPIQFGSVAAELQALLEQVRPRQIFVICDVHTEEYCLPLLKSVFEGRSQVVVCTIPAGEVHKTLITSQLVWKKMLDATLDRQALVICLGGGTVTDLGGFCASLWKRGLEFVHIPTTLLGMVDAAIGGKTGLDFEGVKNVLGTFRQPKSVLIDPVFLETLPKFELMSGLAEVIKHTLIADHAMWEKLQTSDNPTESDWNALIPRAFAVKMHIVARDPNEKGIRKLLNFGHTVGHAIEAWSHQTGNPISHGHAVALGMVHELSRVEPNAKRTTQLRAFIERTYPFFDYPDLNSAEIRAFMRQDKKNSGGEIRFSIPGKRKWSMQELVWE